ncbi:MAG TPA: LysM peptidoglycan-binding domain-containing protein, partial [Chromatiales bacterium]|nr:LysM peptidoglycan-binding domain-containing protein [Chromatiales bacterium]
MDNAHRRSVLQQEITDILARRTASSAYLTTPDQAHSVVTRSLVCGSMALLALNPAPAYAVGLGEIRLSSALGEPLQATVPVQLGKDEQLASGCIGLAPRSTGDLTELRNTRLQIDPASGPGVFQLRISTTGSLPEPMYALNLRVDCPGLPVVQRQYVVMLDLPGLSLPAATAARALPARHKPASTSRHSVVSQPRPATSVSPLQHSTDPIPAGSTYRVREGDTLSTIAARIQGRPANFTWPLAGLIFRTNPRAFVRGNPDLIKLGWVIQIPEPAEWATLTPVQGPARLTTVTPPVHTGQPAEPVPVVPPVQIPATLAQPKPASTETQPAQPDTETVQALPAVKPQAIAETDSPFADEHAGSGQMADASTVEADATPATAIANTDSIAADIDTSDATTETEKPSVDTADPAAQAQIVAAAERPVTTTVNPLLGGLFGILIGL